MRNDQDKNATRVADLKRVDEILQRSTVWLIGLLTAQIAAISSLVVIDDIVFFKPSTGMQLPFTSVMVPIRYFFYGTPMIIAVAYLYIQIYLSQLWSILGKLSPIIDGRTLSEWIHPWHIADFALRWRDRLRRAPRDQCAAQHRALSSIADFAAVVLVWLFTPVVLAWFWWRSMPAHDPWMTGLIGGFLLATIYVGVGAYASARKSLSRVEESPRNPGRPASWVFGAVLPVVAVLTVLRAGVDPPQRIALGNDGKPFFRNAETVYEPQSWDDYIVSVYCPWTSRLQGVVPQNAGQSHWAPLLRLEPPKFCEQRPKKSDGESIRDWHTKKQERKVLPDWALLASADLSGEVISEKPKDWLGLEFAKAEFKAKWCRDRSPDLKVPCPSALVPDDDTGLDKKQKKAFDQDWRRRREALLAGFTKTNLEKADLRRANLSNARLEGVDLREARLEGASLIGARLEGAELGGADLEGADLSGARLEGANLSSARLEGAWLVGARLDGADLRGARLEGAELGGADLEGADLSGARLDGASLSFARLEGADLSFARLDGADLRSARLNGANLSFAGLDGADLSGARLEGANLNEARLEGANLGGARLEGASLIGARLEGAELGGADLEGANLSVARVFGTKANGMDLSYNRFKATRVEYAAFRYVNLKDVKVDDPVGLETTFGDGTVELPIGAARPCQWMEGVLTDEEYFGRWRGWQEANSVPPFDFSEYTDIPPPSYCVLPEYRRDRPPPPSLPSPSP